MDVVDEMPGPDIRSVSTRSSLSGADVDHAAFIAHAVREIRKSSAAHAGALEGTVEQLIAASHDTPPADAVNVELAIYEAAVRAGFSPSLAAQGLDLLLAHPAALGSNEGAHSCALLFATACDRLEELLERLQSTGVEIVDPQSRFVNSLTCAKLCLVRDDPIGLAEHADRAAAAATRREDAERAERLRRAAYWLVPERDHRISRWRLADFHHVLPRQVAECLERGDLAGLDQAGAPHTILRHLRAASGLLADTSHLAEDPNGRQSMLRQLLADWAMRVANDIMDADEASTGAAVPFTGAAWRLLEPDPPAAVREGHARAVAHACGALDEEDVVAAAERVVEAMPLSARPGARFVPDVVRAWKERGRHAAVEPSAERPDLARLLERASTERPRPTMDLAVPEAAYRLNDISTEVEQVIEACLLERWRLLPDEPPFRGRMWFDSGTTHLHYREGRDERDLVASYRAFEEAWRREPNNWVTIQGLILGLRRRLGEKPGRDHLLQHLARLLDRVAEREVEAALAYASLADLASLTKRWRDRRRYLEAAAAALARRVRRRPWTRARNAQIAVHLELGNLVAAGNAAWEESRLYLPGSPASRRFALLAAALWERTIDTDQSLASAIDAAQRHAASPFPTTQAAVRYAADIRRLVVLSDLSLDDDALEDLWWNCRGDVDELCRFLERRGRDAVDPRRHYLAFMSRKLGTPEASAAVQDDDPGPAAARRHARLRLAAAEVLSRDPVHELAISSDGLAETHLTEFIATLRECAGEGETALGPFVAAIRDTLTVLVELQQAIPASGAGLDDSRLTRASESLALVRRKAEQFHEPLAGVALLLTRHLALSLEAPITMTHLAEKGRRLVPSTLGTELGRWWVDICATTGPLDFFHFHQAYRCPPDMSPAHWWVNATVHGKPVREAVAELALSLDKHARRLGEIDARYRSYRNSHRRGSAGFGLRGAFDASGEILRAALAPQADPARMCAIAGALERLSTSLRRIDMGRLTDVPDLLYDPALPTESYLLPRATELLVHWRRNAMPATHLQVVFEVHDDAAHDVLCLMCLDAGPRPVPAATVPLHGLDPFADLVEALGGQFHLWIARSAGLSGCRLDHHDGMNCTADEYVLRIADRLRDLSETTWYVRQAQIQSWLGVLDSALRTKGNAALAFAILPHLRD